MIMDLMTSKEKTSWLQKKKKSSQPMQMPRPRGKEKADCCSSATFDS
jgi:hypothetical protein